VAYARRVVEADREATRAGRGSFQIDGRMIDVRWWCGRSACWRAISHPGARGQVAGGAASGP